MRLNVDFTLLEKAALRMGAEVIDTGISIDLEAAPLDPIDINLEAGIEIPLSDVDINNGLLGYRGRQVILYIQDHSWGVRDALEEGSRGCKFHVAYCRTLEEMRSKGRYERYVATNDLSGEFYITGVDQESGEAVEGETSLKVCKNCLDKLNYQGYQNNRSLVFLTFSLAAFFENYRSLFPHMPTRRAGQFDGQYTPDWPEVRDRYVRKRKFTCENCRVILKDHPQILEVHHINGVKTDNSESNLRALCADCHQKQPSHGHMSVSDEVTMLVADLRQKQGLSNGDK
jgi:hypothetical protein